MKEYITRTVWIITGVMLSLDELIGQSPTHIDTRKKDPQLFTLDDYLVYVAFPVLLFVAAIWFRYYKKKNPKKEED